MKRCRIPALALAIVLTAAFTFPAVAADATKPAGDVQTLVGTINEDARFETSGGEEYLLVGDRVEDVIIKQGEKLKITGAVRTEGAGKAIAVQEFKVLDDYEFRQEMEKQQTGRQKP